MNNNFKMSLMIAPHDALRMRIDICLTPKTTYECTPNPNFSSNHGDNENDRDNEDHPDNKNEGNYPANKYMF